MRVWELVCNTTTTTPIAVLMGLLLERVLLFSSLVSFNFTTIAQPLFVMFLAAFAGQLHVRWKSKLHYYGPTKALETRKLGTLNFSITQNPYIVEEFVAFMSCEWTILERRTLAALHMCERTQLFFVSSMSKSLDNKIAVDWIKWPLHSQASIIYYQYQRMNIFVAKPDIHIWFY